MPVPYTPNSRAFQHEVAEALRRARPGGRSNRRSGRVAGDGSPGAAERVAVREHPVHACPDRDRHVRSLAQLGRARRELEAARREVSSRTGSLARRFDQVLQLLEAWGYLDGWALTDRGRVLARTYHESDLLVAEAMSAGLLDGLDPASLAGLVSCFTYEQRGPGPAPPPTFPSRLVRTRFDELERLAEDIRDDEDRAGLPLTRPPDPGFVAIAHAWAAGEDLGDVLGDEDLSGGDFVRNIKTLLDLLRQVGEVAPDAATARNARRAAEAVHRGVVSVSSTLDEIVGDDAAGPGGSSIAVEAAEEPDEPLARALAPTDPGALLDGRPVRRRPGRPA
jgi:ATP-dependent RNA helicase HelY